MQKNIEKKILENGLTVLVNPTTTVPKVSVQLFYNVGSKDEKTGQKGLAHLIEHMIFKGTKMLSESDINMITHKLSGSCNAFTSYDYTGYMFDFPSSNWEHALPIMADCMKNCTFNQQFLNSEMKAVIQELKMYRDNHTSSLVEQMISTIFADHPYHYPIIGFKQDLWSATSEKLKEFYQKHYHPNNATLVVVGHVQPEEVFALAQKYFGTIEPDWNYKKEEFYHSADLCNKSIVVQRDVQQPHMIFAFEVPGSKEGKDFQLDLLSTILGSGRTSRLYKKLVDELELAVEVDAFLESFVDQGLLFLYVQPTDVSVMEQIKHCITQELEGFVRDGVAQDELDRALVQAEIEILSLRESNQKQAYFIGRSYLATGNHNQLFDYCTYDPATIKTEVETLLRRYCRPTLMHSGSLVPLQEADKVRWQELQKISDQEDARILARAQRDIPVEDGVLVHTIEKKPAQPFSFAKPERRVLENGMTLLWHHNPQGGRVELAFSLKAKHYYDPENLSGLYNVLSHMLAEGTKNYTKQALDQALEDRGIELNLKPGYIGISCLPKDVGFAIHILAELLLNANLAPQSLDKIKKRVLADIAHYWDEPTQFIKHLAKKEIYKNHPYAKSSLGTSESIARITIEDIKQAYAEWFSPEEAILSLVGNLHGYDVLQLVHQELGHWNAKLKHTLAFPDVVHAERKIVHHAINRDQVVLAFAGKSIDRHHPDYDKILLFDQIFTGGVLGSMSSRLFALRERSGLFYTIGGSLLYDADHQPGMVYIRTIVSPDRLQEAHQAIINAIATAHAIDDAEFMQAQDALVHAAVDSFETNKGIAHTFMFLERLQLPFDYFDNRAALLYSLKKEEVSAAVQALLNPESLVVIKAGRP